MNNSLLKTLFISALMALAIPASAAVESTDPIKLTIHDWTGQYLTTHIMGAVLKEAGYNVEYVQADYIAQFAGLESGDLHIAMEMWETTGKAAMDGSLKTGKTVDLGETGMDAKEEWWYPMYMNDFDSAVAAGQHEFSTMTHLFLNRYISFSNTVFSSKLIVVVKDFFGA